MNPDPDAKVAALVLIIFLIIIVYGGLVWLYFEGKL